MNKNLRAHTIKKILLLAIIFISGVFCGILFDNNQKGSSMKKIAENQKINYGEVVFLGDSYGTGANARGHHKSDISFSWPNQTAVLAGIDNFINLSVGGMGIAREAGGDFIGKHFHDMALYTKMRGAKINNLDAVRWVIVQGGYNDKTQNLEKIQENGKKMIENIRKTYKNAQIAIGMIGWRAGNTPVDQKIREDLKETPLTQYKKIAKDNDILYIDGAENALKNRENSMSDDNFHPNFIGERAIAENTVNFLRKNTLNIEYHNGDKVFTEIYVAGKNNTFKKLQKNGMKFLGWGYKFGKKAVFLPENIISDKLILENDKIELYAIWQKNGQIEF